MECEREHNGKAQDESHWEGSRVVQNDWYDAENRDSADAEKACQTDRSPKSRPRQRAMVHSVIQVWARL